MKNILVVTMFIALSACQSLPQSPNSTAQQSTQDVTPCTNGFDSVNVCELTS